LHAVYRLKTLHKYITGQVLASLLLTVAVFAFVVLLLNVLRDVLPLLIGGHVSLLLVSKAIGLLLPFACVYALPMGFITATLLVFGRFSADQELTAMRASGVSLLSLITPVVILSLLCCGLSAWFNLELGPMSRVMFLNLKYDLLHEIANAQIPEGQMIYDFPGYMFYVGKNRGGELEDVNIYRLQNSTNWDVLIHAAHGRLKTDRALNQLVVDLTDARVINPNERVVTAVDRVPWNFSLNSVTNRNTKPSISDMTIGQLQQELRELQANQLAPAPVNASNAPAGSQRTSLLVSANIPQSEVVALYQNAKRNRDDQIGRVRVAMHREIAFSFACFGFTLVGIPLGIRVHRRETNIGMAMALALVAVYYGFTMLGVSMSARPEWYPHLILWLPNFIFQAVGAVLLWRANRGI
jgi:lipopolysaccharide export system permease protein